MSTSLENINNLIYKYIPSKHRNNGGGIQFNCPMCVSMGESRNDTKMRGGMKFNGDGGFIYNCFNCHFSTGWSPGGILGKKVRQLFKEFGMSDEEVNYCIFETFNINKQAVEQGLTPTITPFLGGEYIKPCELPDGSQLLTDILSQEGCPEDATEVADYIINRNIKLFDVVPFLWSPSTKYLMNHRAIIPYIVENSIVGYTARLIDKLVTKDTQRYYQHLPSKGFIYNMDTLELPYRKYIIVTEGVIDAKIVDGVGLMENHATEAQESCLNSYSSLIKIVMPDRNKAGKKLIEQAKKNRWGVSFPDFGDGVIDVDDAFKKFNRLFIIDRILSCAEYDPTMIDVKTNQMKL